MLTKNKMLIKKEKLLELELKDAAKYFNVSERTIRRWKEFLKIYDPKIKYRPGKVGKKIAIQIRNMYRSDKYTQKKIG
jgi:predicted DNA-binding transcriptional regulator YafY